MKNKQIVVLLIVVSAVVISGFFVYFSHNKEPEYTPDQLRFIGIANEKLKTLNYNIEDKELEYDEYDATTDKSKGDRGLREYLQNSTKMCLVEYSPKGKHVLGGVAMVYIDMETDEILHVELLK